MNVDRQQAGAVVGVFMLAGIALLLRWSGLQQPHSYSFDEDLHAYLSVQWSERPFIYSATGFHDILTQQGRNVPTHYQDPLYAHPPMFTLLGAVAHRLRPPLPATAPLSFDLAVARSNVGWLSLLCGALTIPLVFLLGARLYGRSAGWCAALFLTVEPIHWICSQKLWMDASLTFFFLAGLTAYAYRHVSVVWQIVMALAFGCAGLTKSYILMVPATLFLFEVMHPDSQRASVRHTAFFLALPLIMQLPWIGWNFHVYGRGYVERSYFALQALERLGGLTTIASLTLLGLPMLLFAWRRYAKRTTSTTRATWAIRALATSLALIALWMVVSDPGHFWQTISESLSLRDVPSFSKAPGLLNGEAWTVYLHRLPLFSPLFLFAFAWPFFRPHQRPAPWAGVICVELLLFFTAWGNYQCRYILPVIPLLAVFSGATQAQAWQSTTSRVARAAVATLILIAYAKTIAVGWHFSLPNNAYYF